MLYILRALSVMAACIHAYMHTCISYLRYYINRNHECVQIQLHKCTLEHQTYVPVLSNRYLKHTSSHFVSCKYILDINVISVLGQ
jgi:hypothetical protein